MGFVKRDSVDRVNEVLSKCCTMLALLGCGVVNQVLEVGRACVQELVIDPTSSRVVNYLMKTIVDKLSTTLRRK